MKKVNKRLTGTHFLDIYRQVLAPEGVIHLKTDSPFLFAYTTAMLDHNSIRPLHATADLYNSDVNEIVPPIRLLRTAMAGSRNTEQIHFLAAPRLRRGTR